VSIPPFGPEEADRRLWDWNEPERWGLLERALDGSRPANFVDAVPGTEPDGREACIVGTRGPSDWLWGLSTCRDVRTKSALGPADLWDIDPNSDDYRLAEASHLYTMRIPGAQPPAPQKNGALDRLRRRFGRRGA
jgi:hypothetical protein